MVGTVELANIHHVALIFENRSFVVVNVSMVWRRKDRRDRRKAGRLDLAIRSVPGDIGRLTNEKRTLDGPCILSPVCADDRTEVITFQELISSPMPVDQVNICYRLLIKDGVRKEI